jgi:hypothetical protein
MSDLNPFPTIFICLGAASLIGGLTWIYAPSGPIAGGLMLLAVGFLGRKGR